MALELQNAVIAAVRAALPEHDIIEEPATPPWLNRPGRAECGAAWPLVSDLYRELTGLELPEQMPPRERRHLDAVLVGPGGTSRILEVDEVQHFNPFRARVLAAYPPEVVTAFDREEWARLGREKTRLEGGGFARPCPPLFPGANGRHRQRAFRDALADLLPLQHRWAPTLRISHLEVGGWIHGSAAEGTMRDLLVRAKGLRTQ